MAGVSSLGVNSGLPLENMVKQFVAIESQKGAALQQKLDATVPVVSAFGDVKSMVSDLQIAATALKSLSSVDKVTFLTSDSAKVSLTASDGDAAGQYKIDVTQIASAQKDLSTSTYASKTTAITTGTMRFTIGTTHFDTVIDSSNNTLEGIRDAINDSSGNTGVTASIVSGTDGLGATTYQLMLTSNSTGAANAFSISDVSGNVSSTLNMSTSLSTAQDAIIKIDDTVTVQRSTNTITDALQGITLNIKAVTTVGSPVTITVTKDQAGNRSAVQTAVNNLLDKYNTLVQGLDIYTGEGIVNDSVFRNIKQNLDGIMREYAKVPSGNVYNYFSDIGIKTGEAQKKTTQAGTQYIVAGSLKADSTKMTSALTNNYDSVVSLLSDEDNGIGEKLTNYLDSVLGQDGIINAKLNGIVSSNENIQALINKESAHIKQYEIDLRKQFTALDVLIANMKSTQNYLTQIFSQKSSSSG